MKKAKVRSLIRVKRDLRETYGPSTHGEPPRTRREFIARGLAAGTTTLMLPSVFDMLSIRQAYGATPCDSLTLPAGLRNVSALVIDAVGGMALTSCVRPMAGSVASPQPYSISQATQTLGIGPGDTFDSALIQGLQLRIGDSFYKTLSVSQNLNVTPAVLAAALSKTSGFTMPGGGQNNDTDQNQQSPAPAINAISNGAMYINSLLGPLASISPPGINFSVLNVQKPSDLNGPVGFRDPILLNQGMVDALTSTTNKLSDCQMGEILARRSFGSQLGTLLKASVTSNRQFGDACYSALFDPTKLPFLANSFNLAQSDKAVRIATMHALHNRFASIGTMQISDSDYHSGETTANDDQHKRLATVLQDWIVSAHLEATQGGPSAAKTAICFIISDGACAMQTTGGGQCVGVADRAEHAMMVAIVYNSAGAIPLRHLNVMTDAESSATNTLAGANPTRIAAASAITYAALSSAGLDDKALQFFSTKFGLNASQVAQLNGKA